MNRVDRAVSEVMRAAKAVKATIEGVSGVFRELMREHGEVAAMFARVRVSSGTDVRRELLPRIREALISHEKGELSEIYPAFRKHSDLAGYAEMHEKEAGTIERMIQRLSAIDYDDPEWGSSFTALEDAVSRHVKEEEGEYFPAACRTLGKRVTEAMTAHYALKRKSIADEMRS